MADRPTLLNIAYWIKMSTSLGRLAMRGNFCVAANLMVALWGFVFPRPFGLCLALLICLPWLSFLVIWFNPDFRTSGFFTLFVSVFVLFTRVSDDITEATPTDKSLAIQHRWFLAVLPLFLLCVFLADRGKLWKRGWAGGAMIAIFFFLPATVLYILSALVGLNMLADRPVQHFAVPIVSRNYRLHLSRRRQSQFMIHGAPKGKWSQPRLYLVSWNTYLFLRGESTACIDAGRGALGVPWYRVSSCGSIATFKTQQK